MFAKWLCAGVVVACRTALATRLRGLSRRIPERKSGPARDRCVAKCVACHNNCLANPVVVYFVISIKIQEDRVWMRRFLHLCIAILAVLQIFGCCVKYML